MRSDKVELVMRPKYPYYAFLFAVLSITCQGQAPDNVYQGVNQFVVCIESQFDHGAVLLGSGFFVAPGAIATVSHQVSAATKIVVRLSDQTIHDAKPLVISRDQGVALLSIHSTTQTNLPLRAEEAVLGEEVFTIGCPLGLEQSLSRGAISHPGRLINGRRLIQTDSMVNPGNSGGPLLDKHGNVVGLIYGFLKGSKGLNFAIPVNELVALMRQAGLNPAFLATPEIYQLWDKAQRVPDPKTRITVYQEITGKASWLTEAFFNQGVAYFEASEYAQAQQSYETAIRKRSDYYQAYTNLGLTLYKLGKFPEARAALLQAITIKPDYALAHLNLGIVYKEGLSDPSSARRSFLRFLELEPGSAEAGEVQRWLKDMPAPSSP